ncbi:MAG: ABC transporter ATP-binding protein [Candidatus Binatia bacterium]
MTALLEVDSIRCGYGGNTVLNGVSLIVGDGETVLLLGPNGHGKSTLARAISGVLPIYSGSISFAGGAVSGQSPGTVLRRGLVHIPQGDLMFPEMTVLENLVVAAGLDRLGWRNRGRRLDEVFELFPRLEERSRQLASTLSGGERRMLALGRGLMRPAELLVIDEPSLGLAPILVSEVYGKISQIAAEDGRSVLLIDESATHLDIADRILVMQSGEIVMERTAERFLDDRELVETYFVGLEH